MTMQEDNRPKESTWRGSDPIRVLLVTQPTVTGAALHVWQLTKRLDRDRYQVTVACPDAGWLRNAVLSSGARYRHLDLTRQIHPFKDLLAGLSLLRIIAQERPHILHLHASKAGFIGRILRPLHRTPVVLYTPHGLAYRQFKGWRRRVYLALERAAGMFGSCTICVSQSERRDALSDHIGKRDRVVVITNGVDLPDEDMEDRQLRAELQLPDSTLLIAMLARLQIPKRPQDLVEAASILAGRSRPFRMVLLGDGSLQDHARSLARAHHVDSVVIFAGYRDEAVHMLPGVDVVVLASDIEGMPFSLLEGMAARKPVVGTRVPGIVDLIDHGVEGYLYTPGRSAELADLLTKLMDSAELRRFMGENGRRRVEAGHLAETMVDANADLYQDLLAKAERR
jgi:glycosyltransferase involved in cell wall biosynthesis